MGSVWVARHVQLDIDVAVKFMTPEAAASANARMRFEREARAAAKLKSTHIVQILDYGVEDTTLYIAMDLLSGEDLASRLKRVQRLSLPWVSHILGQACRGVALAHDAGIVHRDLKPANLFMAREGPDEVVKVLDFGIAKAPDSAGTGAETRAGALIGSPYYMSPEQFLDSKSVDWRSDIWALGVIAFQCLTGREPFGAVQLGQILANVCTEPHTDPLPCCAGPRAQCGSVLRNRPRPSPREALSASLDFALALQALADAESRATSGPPAVRVPTPSAPALDAPRSRRGLDPGRTGRNPKRSRSGVSATALTGSVSQPNHNIHSRPLARAPPA